MPLGRIHLYWLLIAIPTLLLGMASARLLLGEEARLRALARRADAERAERLAETVRGLVATVKQDVLEQLVALPAAGYPAALGDWMSRDPRIRNVFVWTPGEGVVLPPARGGTAEERRFLQRYAPLFEGEVPWAQHPVAGDGGLARAGPASPERQARVALDQLRAKARPAPAAAPPPYPTAPAAAPVTASRADGSEDRARLGGLPGAVAVAPADANRAPAAEADAAPAATPEPGHWRTWFEGNQLYLLGWQRLADGAIRGVELETATLLSRLPDIFASLRDPATWLALRNGEGGVLVQSGGAAEAPGPIGIVVPLAPELPHWEIVCSRLDAHSARRPMLLAAWLLLSLVLAALVSGGLLLARDAAMQRRDALQKTSFVSSVSHELKTPLTSIRLYAELLRDGRVSEAPKQGQYLNVIVAESERLTRLVNNVLDFSRMEQGRRRYAIESADLARILREVADAQRDRLRASGLTLVLAGCDAPVVLPVDRDAVEQVMVNLLDNAAKYAAGGGEVTVALHATPDGADITVEDRGPGIAPPHRKRLFESFYRADCELTSHCTGCGLGLSIARRLMRGMGGDLLFAPREGGGCSFTLRVGEKATREAPA
ncbi:MAG: HAMP domain-containing histidine kinase [Lentisphaerae bacterium]|nr:HAMP domain-containing histidine kinase [Lentisphaerota bacterium]